MHSPGMGPALAWLLALLALTACAPSGGDRATARAARDQARSRERAEGVCAGLCDKTRSVSAKLGCEPIPFGCEEICLVALPSSMVPCLDEVEAEVRCVRALPVDAFACEAGGGFVEQRPGTCEEESRAVTACRVGPPRPTKPGYVGPTPPRPDPSRPDVQFCTPLDGADIDDVSAYIHRQARPAGWELDGIRDEGGVQVFCFAAVPAEPPP